MVGNKSEGLLQACISSNLIFRVKGMIEPNRLELIIVSISSNNEKKRFGTLKMTVKMF